MASRLVRVSLVTVNDVLDGHVKLDLECHVAPRPRPDLTRRLFSTSLSSR